MPTPRPVLLRVVNANETEQSFDYSEVPSISSTFYGKDLTVGILWARGFCNFTKTLIA